MPITPTLETLRFISIRIAEIRKHVRGDGANLGSQDESLAVHLIEHLYAQQFAELVRVLHEAGHTPLALDVTLHIPLPAFRSAALQYLGSFGPGHLAILREAFWTITEIGSERERGQALIQLASDLPLDLLPEAVTLARQMSWGYGQVCLLNALAQKCVDPGDRYALMTEAFESALQISNAQETADAILVLMPEMDWPSTDRAIKMLSTMIPRLPSEEAQGKLLSAIAEHLYIWLNTNQVPVTTLISHFTLLDKTAQKTLPPQLYQDIMPQPKTDELMAPVLPETLLQWMVKELKMVVSKGDWVQAIIDLLPLLQMRLSDEQVGALYSEAASPGDRSTAIQLFTANIPSSIVPDILGLVPCLPSYVDQAELLAALTPRLSNDALDEALSLICSLPATYQYDVFPRIAPTLPESHLQLAISHLKTLPSSPEQTKALMALSR